MLRLLTLSLILIASSVAADISGSFITFLGPWTVENGEMVTFDFEVGNGSPDGAVLDEFIFAFHSCVTVLAGGYDDTGASNFWLYAFDNSTPNVARWWHPTDDIGSHMVAGDSGPFWLTVQMDYECPCGLLPINWTLLGLGGEAPNELTGLITYEAGCPTATAESHWGMVKSLY